MPQSPSDSMLTYGIKIDLRKQATTLCWSDFDVEKKQIASNRQSNVWKSNDGKVFSLTVNEILGKEKN